MKIEMHDSAGFATYKITLTVESWPEHEVLRSIARMNVRIPEAVRAETAAPDAFSVAQRFLNDLALIVPRR